MYSRNTVIKLNDIAHRYRDIIHQALHAALSSLKNTGAGVASLTVDVIDGDEQKSPEIQIRFDDHLIFLDKRGMQWTKQPDVKKLTAWAETKSFSSIPGYTVGKAPKFNTAERVAWAIAKDKKKNDSWKGKPWRKKSLSKVLKEMNALIIEAYNKAIEEDLQAAIDAGARV